MGKIWSCEESLVGKYGHAKRALFGVVTVSTTEILLTKLRFPSCPGGVVKDPLESYAPQARRAWVSLLIRPLLMVGEIFSDNFIIALVRARTYNVNCIFVVNSYQKRLLKRFSMSLPYRHFPRILKLERNYPCPKNFQK